MVASRGQCVTDTVRWVLSKEGAEGPCWFLAGKFPESAAGNLLRWRLPEVGQRFDRQGKLEMFRDMKVVGDFSVALPDNKLKCFSHVLMKMTHVNVQFLSVKVSQWRWRRLKKKSFLELLFEPLSIFSEINSIIRHYF